MERPCHNSWHLFMKQYGKSEGELFHVEIKLTWTLFVIRFSTSAEGKQAIAEIPTKFNKQASFKYKNLLPQEKKDLKKCQAPVSWELIRFYKRQKKYSRKFKSWLVEIFIITINCIIIIVNYNVLLLHKRGLFSYSICFEIYKVLESLVYNLVYLILGFD